MKKTLALVCILTIGAASILGGCTQKKPYPQKAKDSFPYYEKMCETAPSDIKFELSGTDINGNEIDSSIFNDYDLTLVNFWEPWCYGCIEEMSDFEEIFLDAQKNGIKFNIIGIYSDDSDNEGHTSVGFINDLGITYTVIKDSDKSMNRRYANGGNSKPVNLFVNSEGYIIPVKLEELASSRFYFFEKSVKKIKDGHLPDDYSEEKEIYDKELKAFNDGKLFEYVLDELSVACNDNGSIFSMTKEDLLQLIADRL